MGHRFVGVSSKAMEVQVATIDPARTSPRSMDIICEVSGKMSSLVQALVKGLGVVHLVEDVAGMRLQAGLQILALPINP